MPDTLIFHYRPSEPDSVSCISRNAQNQFSNIETLSLTELAEKAQDQKCIALLDSSVLTIATVNLPTQNRQRQIQAVPFALEDQLASDIDDTHFALSKKQQGHELTVAAINRDILDELLQQFTQAGLVVDTLLPDVLALPLRDHGWTVLIDQQRALIKMSADQGCYTDLDNLAVLLKSLISKSSQPPQQLLLIHADEDNHAAQLIDHADMALSVETFDTDALTIFANNFQNAQQLNILQGPYTYKKQSDFAWQPWRAVAALAGVWLVLQMTLAVMETQQLEQKNMQLTRQIEQQFKRALPEAKKFTGMRNRMKNRLKELKSGSGTGSDQVFLDILAEAAPALTSNKKVTINGISYRSKHLDLDLQTDSLQNLESVKNKLAAIRGIKAILSTTVEKDTVKGRLRLEKQG
ncbi:MAG: type II secretion system protein GspL [Gammaproteobacteria bacterium]